MKNRILEVQNLTKIYREKKQCIVALDNFNLSIYAGEILSLLGVNGAGKTTLSTILATLHPPTSGQVLYRGNSIYQDVVSYRRILGYCPQQPNLDLYLNVEDNLRFAGRYFLLPKHTIKERVAEIMQLFGLDRYAKFNVQQLSGGWKRRLLIARSLVHEPEIVILDEPTVGLDPDIRRQLWKVIQKLKEQGITIILTTHYLEEAEILSDRVCILHKGRVLFTETVEVLKQKQKKKNLEEAFLQMVQQQREEEYQELAAEVKD